MRNLVALFALILALAAAMDADTPRQPITTQWIEHYEGNPNSFAIQRPGKGKLAFEPLMSLLPKDVIEITDQTSWVELHLEKQGKFYVCKFEKAGHPCDQAPPFTVPATKGELRVSDRVVGWLHGVFSDWLEAHQNTTPQDADSTRGGAIAVPLLATPHQRLLEGHRKICLAWTGGSEPYRLRIVNKVTQRRLLDAERQSGQSWCSEELELVQGIYQLRLSGGDSVFESDFLVVGEAEVPQIPRDDLAGLSTELQRTVSAAWLSGKDRGVWQWESYSSVVPLCDTYRPAEALCRSQERGAPLSTMPDSSDAK